MGGRLPADVDRGSIGRCAVLAAGIRDGKPAARKSGLSAADPKRRCPSILLRNLQAIRRLQSLGVATLNLGGGVCPGDSLAFFKERFNGTCRKLTSVCQIYDPEKYDLLCQQAGVGRDACYFPAYRAPRERMAASVPIVGEPAAAGKGDSDQNTMLSQSQSCLN